MKYISILGSTGSIGTQTLEVVRANGDIAITALTAGSNIDLLEKQIREFKPEYACVYDEGRAHELRRRVSDTSTKVLSGMDGMISCATLDMTEIVVTAVVGMIGIRPTIAAIEAGKDIALANKETLVTAGHLIMPLIKKHDVRLLPVDSEHSAIFQSLRAGNEIERIILTASGGPFRGKKRKDLENVSAKDALKHPNWSMGPKITIDSATMVNKGLEVIEASWLFNVPPEKIEVHIQPQSIIHSAVEFVDGSIIAQMGTPDMKLPIQYALYYPERRPLVGRRVDFFELGKLTFERPDTETFTMLPLAYEVLRGGGSLPTVYNAANEYAVSRFLKDEIPFLAISELIALAVRRHERIPEPSVEQILQVEQETVEFLERECRKMC